MLILRIDLEVTAYLATLPRKLRGQIMRRIEALRENQSRLCPAGWEVTEGGESVWQVRSGDYHILYVIYATEIRIIKLDNRKDVYR